MGGIRARLAWVSAFLICGCATNSEAPRHAHPVDAVRKVIESLSTDVAQRLTTEAFRNLPVVVRTTAISGASIEPIVAELLRTRLVERGIAVEAACAPRCMEITLQEFAVDSTAKSTRLTPGQLLTVGGGNIPVVGGLVRSLGEQEREKERAASRATGFLVTFAARDGNRYTARANVVAITSAGDVALEQK